MEDISKNNNLVLLKLIALTALIAAACVYSRNINSAALTWPSIDNLSAICRMLDDTCLANDFFTDASSGTTPRLPYIYFLYMITRLVDNGIGGGLIIVKAILLALLPVVFSVLIVASINTHSRSAASRNGERAINPLTYLSAICAPIVILAMQGKLGSTLSVAWWAPLYFDGTPHNFSLFLTLAGFCFLYFRVSYLGAALIFLGGIIHPAVSIFTSVFACILLSRITSLREVRYFIFLGLVPGIISALLIKIYFDTGGVLSAEEFVRIYVIERHPSHYLPSQFGSLSKTPWNISFLLICAGLTATTAALYKLGSNAWKNSFLALVSYAGAVGLQYLFVEIHPVKLIAALGPSRFTLFGPWFLFIFSFLLVQRIIKDRSLVTECSILFDGYLGLIKWRFVLCGYLLLLIMVVYYATSSHKFELPDQDSRHLAKFALDNTGTEDVFALPFYGLRTKFPLVTGRAIFHGNGFPFSEKYFVEWDIRNKMINGDNSKIKNNPGNWIGDKYSYHYNSLKPRDFVKMASIYRLDWVVLESEYSDNFSTCKVDFLTVRYKVYSLHTLNSCAYQLSEIVAD